jgi:hypothetical protein
LRFDQPGVAKVVAVQVQEVEGVIDHSVEAAFDKSSRNAEKLQRLFLHTEAISRMWFGHRNFLAPLFSKSAVR